MKFYSPNLRTISYTDFITATAEKYLRSKGFVRVTVPRIVPASGACENVDTLFEIGVSGNIQWFNYGKKRAYFAQTGQLYLESLLGRGGLSRVYCIGPSGRAEQSVDTRHLTEFEMIEIEFRGNFNELLKQIEGFISNLVKVTKRILKSKRQAFGLPEVLGHLDNSLPVFPRIRYQDAVEEMNLEWGSDISSAQEQELIKNHGGGPIFIVKYPNPESKRMKKLFRRGKKNLAIKFFNMIPDPDNQDYVLSADCIVPYGGECVGAAARVWSLSEFKKRLFNSLMFKALRKKEKNARNGFSWYLKMLEKYPSLPHVGCGFGMSRILQFLLAEEDITKVVTFSVK